jgi:recombination protein RecA
MLTMSNLVDKKALDLAIATLDKQFGKGTVIHGDAMPDEVDVISTGNFKLDLALGVGGFLKVVSLKFSVRKHWVSPYWHCV